MTIQWRYTVEPDLGILSACGHRAPEAVRRFAGGRRLGTGPVIVDLTELRDWSAEGWLAEPRTPPDGLLRSDTAWNPAEVPTDGSLVPDDGPPTRIHADLATALAEHGVRREGAQAGQTRRTTEWRDRLTHGLGRGGPTGDLRCQRGLGPWRHVPLEPA
ncbi:anti-sigma factor antagonist [Streptomyces europaeiscabiei]|uniref:anti-sigma factor antagonist n=1 Tax=Streptomyces europaeiscabiei TaxID=146819 RepID=UPI0038F6B70E